ncbi:MAG TPA: response regulator transcription factor [Thermodesulfobacteriota bacterium]|nr:response regulator transcription factor [Thermodesulfobacteriota bacterium]
MSKITIFVADDHPIVKEGLITILNTQSDFKVVGEAMDGTKVVSGVEETNPDILVLDLEMPGMDGIEIIEKLNKSGCKAKAIIFTAYKTDDRIFSAFELGAKGYLLKGSPKEEIFDAVRNVYNGGTSVHPDVTDRLVKGVNQKLDKLTPRELDVMKSLSRGLTNKEIAYELFISERTVKFHISSIFTKLGAETRTEALSIAIQKGLLSI